MSNFRPVTTHYKGIIIITHPDYKGVPRVNYFTELCYGTWVYGETQAGELLVLTISLEASYTLSSILIPVLAYADI